VWTNNRDKSLSFDVTATPTNGSSIVDEAVMTACTNDSTGVELAPKKPWSLLKQPLYAVALLTAVYVVVAVVGIVSNSVVVTAICRQARMRTVTNYFLANLAVADILVCVVVLPLTLLQNIFNGTTRHKDVVPVGENVLKQF